MSDTHKDYDEELPDWTDVDSIIGIGIALFCASLLVGFLMLVYYYG